jgi:hypothetical protein
VSSPPAPTKTSGLVGSTQALCLGEAAEVLLGVWQRGQRSGHPQEGKRTNMAYFTSGGRERWTTRTKKGRRR